MKSDGRTLYSRCLCLLKAIEKKGKLELTELEMAESIAMYIGSSKKFNTVQNAINLMVHMGMIEQTSSGYKINVEKIRE